MNAICGFDEMGFGWDRMLIIGHRSSKSTFVVKFHGTHLLDGFEGFHLTKRLLYARGTLNQHAVHICAFRHCGRRGWVIT